MKEYNDKRDENYSDVSPILSINFVASKESLLFSARKMRSRPKV